MSAFGNESGFSRGWGEPGPLELGELESVDRRELYDQPGAYLPISYAEIEQVFTPLVPTDEMIVDLGEAEDAA